MKEALEILEDYRKLNGEDIFDEKEYNFIGRNKKSLRTKNNHRAKKMSLRQRKRKNVKNWLKKIL